MSYPSETQPTAPNTTQTTPQATTDSTDLVLLIFIHGFKGADSTFGEFPQRLRHILSESIDNTVVESVVFPAYETKGELNAAVVRFADWLTDLTVKREVANGGAGKAKVVLCGHSMGGLLAADALIEFVRTRPDKHAPLWPKIVACIAYDTPYLGLHPNVIKNTATQATQYVRTAQNVLNSFKTWRSKTPSGAAAAAAAAAPGPAPIDTNASPGSDAPEERDDAPKSPTTPKTPTAESSEGTTVTSLWQKWAAPAAVAIGGAVLAGTVAGTAYYKREEVGVGYTWVADHLKYVGSLWNRQDLEARLDRLLDTELHMGVLFHTFYTYIPATPPAYSDSRAFVVLPPQNSPMATHFMPNRNTLASDEIQAHTGMFDNKTNDGYYDLGLVTAKLIREAVYAHRRTEANAQFPPPPPNAQAQPRPPPQQPDAVKTAVRESVATRQPELASTTAVVPPAVAGSAAVAAAAASASAAASATASVPAAPPPPADEEVEDEDDDDDDDDDESEEDEEHIPVMEKPHVMTEKVETTQAATAAKAEEEAEEDEEQEEDDDDEDEDDDDDDDDEEEDEDEDEDEEEEAEAQPAKK